MYAEILVTTKAMEQSNNPSKPKSSRSEKYKNIIKPIWEKKKTKIGKGIILPQDPDALVNMLHLLVNSFKAGNTGVRNEIHVVSICDELLSQGAIDKEYYKTINNVSIKHASR